MLKILQNLLRNKHETADDNFEDEQLQTANNKLFKGHGRVAGILISSIVSALTLRGIDLFYPIFIFPDFDFATLYSANAVDTFLTVITTLTVALIISDSIAKDRVYNRVARNHFAFVFASVISLCAFIIFLSGAPLNAGGGENTVRAITQLALIYLLLFVLSLYFDTKLADIIFAGEKQKIKIAYDEISGTVSAATTKLVVFKTLLLLVLPPLFSFIISILLLRTEPPLRLCLFFVVETMLVLGFFAGSYQIFIFRKVKIRSFISLFSLFFFSILQVCLLLFSLTAPLIFYSEHPNSSGLISTIAHYATFLTILTNYIWVLRSKSLNLEIYKRWFLFEHKKY